MLTEEQIQYIMSKTGASRSNAGHYDYVLKELEPKVEVKKVKKVVKKKGVKK